MFVVITILILWLFLSGLMYVVIRKKKTSLSFLQVTIFFGCKIAAGAAYGYIFKHYYHGDDTWGLNHDALIQYRKLLQTPTLFFSEIFSAHPYPADALYYFSPSGYLENLEYSIVTKIFAVFDLISQGNYFINIVFFNFLSFIGLYLLYKLVAEQLSARTQMATAIILFLFPPALFWLSGLRAEGLLILFSGIILNRFNCWLIYHKTKYLLLAITSFAVCLILRNGYAILLLAPLTAWWLTVRYRMNIAKVYGIVYFSIITFIVAGSYLLPEKFNTLAIIAARQHEFFGLTGNTRFNLTLLDNRPVSFIHALPEALFNTFIRPFPWEAKGPLQWFAAVENIFVLVAIVLTIYACIGKKRHVGQRSAIIWLLLAISLFNYMVIGYIVPFPGAIVRYKSIPELLLIAALILCLPMQFRRHKDQDQRITASAHI